MTQFDIAELMGRIDECYIQEAVSTYGSGLNANKNVQHAAVRPSRRSTRKTFRILLIAAVLSAAFMSVALATGWFGLDSLKIGKRDNRDVISIQGYIESVEYKAAKELYEYMQQPSDAEMLSDEEVKKLAEEHGSYGVYTKEGRDKLFELCEKYELRTLGAIAVPEGEKSFSEAAGIGRLTGENAGIKSIFGSGYITEDGSFSLQGEIDMDNDTDWMTFDFRRSMKGTLGYVFALADPDCTEWDYKSEQGVTLHLAQGAKNSYILLDSEEAFYFVNISMLDCKLAEKELESVAECFDWRALTDPQRGMDGEFTSPDTRNSQNIPTQYIWDENVDGYELMRTYENIGTETEPDYIYYPYEIGEISAAKLHVKSMDKYYALTDSTKLDLLRETLGDNNPGRAAPVDMEAADRLFIDFADGSKIMFYTGGNAFRSDDIARANALSYSMYELFDVALDVAGRSENDGIVTYHTDYKYGWVEFDYESGGHAIERRVHMDGHMAEGTYNSARYFYNESGLLEKELWYENGTHSSTVTYTYTADGKQLTKKTETDLLWTLAENVYDDMGRLILTKVYDEQHPDGNLNAYVYYDYDAEGNCRAGFGCDRLERVGKDPI